MSLPPLRSLSIPLLAAAAFFSGCSSFTYNRYGTPLSTDPVPLATYPIDVNYDVLGVGSGQACGSLEKLRLASMLPGSTEPGASGSPILYQEAKYKAIEQIPNADNLMFIRVRIETEGDKQCVTVTGRGYRINSLKSHPGGQP